jgi:hypothetical protein
MGSDQPDDAGGGSGGGSGGFQEAVDIGGQPGRVIRVELAGEDRRTDALGRGQGRDEESRRGRSAEVSHGLMISAAETKCKWEAGASEV